MSFNNYKKYIKYNENKISTNKYVIRLELGFPVIKNFSQTNVKGRIFKKAFEEGKSFDYKQDILDVIEKNRKKIFDKAKAKFELLEIVDTSIILGIEISDEYDRDRISRFVGNFFSSPLFHDKKWFLLVDKDTHLFRIKEFAEYQG